MGDEFQAGICSGNWWNSNRSGLSMSSCSTALNDMGSYGWTSEARSSCEETTASVSDSSIVFQHTQKQPQPPESVDGGGGAVLMDSSLQMMGLGPSSLTMDWNQTLLRGSGRGSESDDYNSMLQDHQIQKDWIPKSSFSDEAEDSSSLNSFNKQINQVFPLDNHQQQRLNPNSGDCSVSFPLFGFDSPETQLQQHQQSTFETHRPIDNPSPNYRINAGQFQSPPLPSLSPSWPKFPAFLKTSPSRQQQQQQTPSQLHFINNTTFWNASAAQINDARSSFFPSPQTQFPSSSLEEKPTCSSLTTAKSAMEELRDSGSMVKKDSSCQPTYKRARIETPSPLPTFKVRKEKLGDRITALQQLVSPFGKTDTASVLIEAIEYIKFLHEQVNVLSTPYMKNGAPTQHQQSSDKSSKDREGPQQDLRSRGLCLVPISSTFPVTNETAADFWTPTAFGGPYR